MYTHIGIFVLNKVTFKNHNDNDLLYLGKTKNQRVGKDFTSDEMPHKYLRK